MTIQHNLNLSRKVLFSTITQSYSIDANLKITLPSIIIKIRVSQEIINNDHASISTQVKQRRIQKNIYFFYLGFLSRIFPIYRTTGEGRAISLTCLYDFHLLHRHLDISQVVIVESSPLHIVSSWTQIGNIWFHSASRQPLRYTLKNTIEFVPSTWLTLENF